VGITMIGVMLFFLSASSGMVFFLFPLLIEAPIFSGILFTIIVIPLKIISFMSIAILRLIIFSLLFKLRLKWKRPKWMS
jgi:hypothetical protein